MTFYNKYNSLYRAVICSLSLMVFSYFIHFGFPVKLIAYTALILTAYIIGKDLKSIEDFKKITGELPSVIKLILFSFIGITGGILFAVLYRWHLDLTLLPKYIFDFSLVAALIGSLEELAFRGYIQESARSVNGPFSILLGAVSHTGYKCCLFLAPVITGNVEFGFLAFWTFTAGLIYGIVRHFSKSIIPSLIAHALFDIIVYAEYTSAPWWVW
jgi:membrane protease YdiL (CAAX protease family)